MTHLQALMATEAEENAYHQGQAHEKSTHQCPTPEKRPYPHHLMSSVDDLADSAYPVVGRLAYKIVDQLNEWLRHRHMSDTPESTR